MQAAPPLVPKEQMLVELSQWLARALQYSPGHASCALLAERTYGTLVTALEHDSPLEFGILKDDVVMGGDARAAHSALRTRLAPYLHERGVLLLRFAAGTTQADLAALVEVLARSAQAVFEAGGVASLLRDHGVARIQVEEIAHEITDAERDEHRRRRWLRSLFADLLREILATPGTANLAGDRLAELLAHPEVAVSALEESSDVAQAASCLALVAQKEDAKGGVPLAPQLRAVLATLSPEARDRLVLGFGPLAGDARLALVWLVGGYAEEELARFLFPSIRAHAGDVDAVLRPLGALVPHDGRRRSVLRATGLLLHDLPADDPTTVSALTALADAPVASFASLRLERECLAEPARAALAAERLASEWRELSPPPPASPSTLPVAAAEDAPPGPPAYDGRGVVLELVKMAGRMKDFEEFVRHLPRAASSLAAGGSVDAVIGLIRGLSEIDGAQWKGLAPGAIEAIATPITVARIVEELERVGFAGEGEEAEDVVALVRLLGKLCPKPFFDWLERSQSRKVRRILLDVLPLASDKLLPILRGRMSGANWQVARNVVLLVPRAGGTTADLGALAHHANKRVRIEVARSLRALPNDAAAMAILVGYLDDSSPEVVRAARAQLRPESLDAPSIEALARQAEDEEKDEDFRRYAIETLGRSAADEAAAALFRVLQPKGLLEIGSSIRDLAATALRGSRAPAAHALFQQGLTSPVRRVRKACEKAAGKA